MKQILIACLVLSAAGVPQEASARQQSPQGSLRITVQDQTGAVIPGARVHVKGSDRATQGVEVDNIVTDGRGVAAVRLAAGHYTVDVSFPGFETQTIADLRVRGGETRRDVTMAIERVAESVAVEREATTAASDPRSDRFSNVLSKDQIDALPDDPDEMEKVLKEMAGPGGTIRVDGFRGGKLPPKSQIRSIRFSSGMFAAENHAAGMTFVDIGTQPGQGPLRGGLDFTFRDGALNARNAFQSEKGPEQRQQYTLNLSGTLVKDRTSFSLSAGGASLYDSANIFAATPGGQRNTPLRRPSDRLNVNARVDHALSKSHALRANFQQNAGTQHNLGVGAFDLAERAFSRTTDESLFRLSESGPWSKTWYAESRFQVHTTNATASSAFDAPTVRVLDAFTGGGAQQAGSRRSTEFELASNVDWAGKKHAARFGALIEGGLYRSDTRTNAFGTFTFPSLADYEAGRPAMFSQRVGDPLVSYAHWQAGVFAQDDWRIRKNLTLSGGVRQEFQTHLRDGWNLGPRAGLTWSPFKNGKTTLRAGAGIFYDWLDADTYEQTLRVDGLRQQDLVVINPGYPDPFSGDATQDVLPSSRLQLAEGASVPARSMLLAGVTHQVSATLGLNFNYSHTTMHNRLRGRNVNAPIAGVRPDLALGNVTQVESSGRMSGDSLNAGLNVNLPKRRTLLFANYSWLHQRNDADGPFSLPSDSYDLASDWGPAAGVPRHVASAIFNTTLPRNVRVGLSTTMRTGVPYNITTGRDENGDTVFADRPVGLGRNSATTAGMWDAAARVSYAFGFGKRPQAAGPGGPQMIMIRGGGAAGDLLGGLPGGGAENKRLRIEIFASVQNVFNHVNPTGYSGVMTSPFFGRPTASAPARTIDLGMKLGF